MNWDSLEREAVDLLSEYVRIDTTNPPGNERAAVEFLGRFLEGEGLEVRYLGKDPERMNLVCRLSSGGRRQGLMFVHHCDVVGANPEEWSVPPFSGVVKEGYIWGRGAMDMKGMGVMEVMAFVLAHRQRIPLKRDLLLVVTCDEESGSQHGAEYLAEHHPKELEAAWGLNEGGAGWKLGDEESILCAFGEKGPLWVRVWAEGRSGHGSTPHDENPCQHLVSAVNALLEAPRPFRILPEMRGFLERLGMWGLTPQELVDRPELKLPNIRAMFQDTMSLTMLKAGSRPNVIPDRAEATLDMRILPDRTTHEVLEEVKRTVPQGPVRVEPIMAIDASSSPLENELYQCIERLGQRFFPNATFLPAICPGFTDSRCFRKLGTACYGWIPAMIEAGDLVRMHGKDERIRIQDLVLGTQVIFEMIRELCG